MTTKAETRSWLETQILAEHSKAQTMRLVHWVGQDAERLGILMEIFLGEPPREKPDKGRDYQYVLTQRSSWALRYIAENAPGIIVPWLPRMVDNLHRKNLHDAIKRNTLNVLEELEPPAELVENLMDLCFGYLGDPQEPIAIRCASMSILEKICQPFPELKEELRLVLEEHLEHGSAGFKSRAGKVLKRL